MQKITRQSKGIYRFYKKGKVEVPSVTTILGLLPKPKIVLWAVIQTIKFLKERGDLSKASTSLGFGYYKRLLNSLAEEGTEIHKIIEDYCMEKKENTHHALKRYKEFVKETNFVCEKAEERVWENKVYKTAGTADLIGHCNQIPILLDLKTSKAVRLSHKIQAVIYKELYCLQNKIDPKTMKSGVLLIPRDKKIKWEYYINTEKEEKVYLEVFKLLSNLFHILLELNELDLT